MPSTRRLRQQLNYHILTAPAAVVLAAAAAGEDNIHTPAGAVQGKELRQVLPRGCRGLCGGSECLGCCCVPGCCLEC